LDEYNGKGDRQATTGSAGRHTRGENRKEFQDRAGKLNRLLWDLWVDEIKWKEKYISRGQYIVIDKRRGRGRG